MPRSASASVSTDLQDRVGPYENAYGPSVDWNSTNEQVGWNPTSTNGAQLFTQWVQMGENNHRPGLYRRRGRHADRVTLNQARWFMVYPMHQFTDELGLDAAPAKRH